MSRDSLIKGELPEIITSSCSPLLQSPQTESILNPANRKFLESQGKQEDQTQLGSKRLIIGTKSYKLDIDGDPLAFPKTPSPVATTPVPPDNDMEVSSQADEQNILSNINDNLRQSQNYKRNPLQRQACIADDMSSDLSSSTATLVDIKSGHNQTIDHCGDHNMVTNQMPQINSIPGHQNANQVVGAALVVAIQSLRLSLEFYKHQSLKLAKVSQRYNESSHLSDEELMGLEKIQELRESIHREIIEMDVALNRHLQAISSSDNLDMSFISQAQIFNDTIKKVFTKYRLSQKKLYATDKIPSHRLLCVFHCRLQYL